MKKINIYRIIIGMGVVSSLVSCNYEEINTNPFEMTDEMGKRDGIAVGGPITSMQKMVTPVGTQADDTDIINQYQVAYNLSADTWSGYFGQNNNWYSGSNHTTLYLQDAWLSSTYKNSYTELLSSWKSVKIESEKAGTPEVFALAQILKVSAWHKTLETFGPIPYTHAGDAALVIPFDSEEETYKAMFNDLSAAIAELTPLAEQNAKVVPDFDAVYGGNIVKWVRYANSLMLRLAMRLKYVSPELSKQYVTQALGHELGVITTKADEAQLSTGAGMVFRNNIEWLSNQYNECRMGTSMYSYLVGYKDPRLQKYFQASESQYAVEAFDGQSYQAVPPGHVYGQNDVFKEFSKPNVTSATPTYWLRASEVYFLRAEAALEWPEFGDAESLYKQGIEMSFEENGISASAAAAYLESTDKPATFNLNAGSYRYSSTAPTQTTIKFEGNKEEKLEKIMIQKWIALYPNGQEAWTEWRRTGYPKLHQVQNNRGSSQGVTDPSRGIRRMIYPQSFYQSEEDKANYNAAVQLLKDKVDTSSSRLWWDCR